MFDGDAQMSATKKVHNLANNRSRTVKIAFVVVSPPRNNLEICIDASVENHQPLSSHQPLDSPVIKRMLPSHDMDNGYNQSNLAFTYHVGGRSYAKAYTPGDAGPDSFLYRGRSVDAQYSYPSCQQDTLSFL